ncbi:putative cytokinetic ring protein SteA [Corynebacterium sp. P3-F1]|uniref:putative cytokinetic ring protein SteA n=1 Tax=Corynebacterium sp. P3-F1 TaxID=3059080 RepID=UPI00265CB231|nr:putative cytokinetic ring protein SteA [Corynebacterium sp. P3-F1]WKK61495.1 putative cytokinetic ring protein SteA [Corynebacterium sp. P3-F1]
MSSTSRTSSAEKKSVPTTAEKAPKPTLADTITGSLRDCTPQGKGLRKFNAGDIAIVDSPDMTRREAQILAGNRPGAVVNIAQFSTGNVPNYGPQLLLDEGIPLLENAGSGLRGAFRDGKKGSVTPDGEVIAGKKAIAHADALDRSAADSAFDESQQHLVDHMEAYFGNTIEFIHTESPLLVDGVGVPELGDAFDGRKVLVVSPNSDTRERVEQMRNFIREFQPIIIGVGSAADTLLDLGYSCDYIVGDPADISTDNLRGDARVILPADPDGHAAGLERIQDLGVGAVTFPAATDSATDLAILLAVFHDAEMIVTVGDSVDLDRIFAGSAEATPAAMLTRLKSGDRIVDSRVIENLYEKSSSGAGIAWAWAILGLLVAVATVILIVGLVGNGSFVDNLVDTWNNFALTVQSWFTR